MTDPALSLRWRLHVSSYSFIPQFATKVIGRCSFMPIHMFRNRDLALDIWCSEFTFWVHVRTTVTLEFQMKLLLYWTLLYFSESLATCSYVTPPSFLTVMKKDLLKIKKHSSDLFLKRNQTNSKDVKLHNDVEVSLFQNTNKIQILFVLYVYNLVVSVIKCDKKAFWVCF